jgi:hypothetical protein
MDIAAILTLKFPNSQWTLNGESYEGLTWLSESPQPTKKELESLWPEVQKEIQKELVRKTRQKQYALTSDPLFFKFQAGEATQKQWLDARAEVEANHPYPSE